MAKLDTESAVIVRQLELEDKYLERSFMRSQVMVQEALASGRASTLSPIKRLIIAAFDTTVQAIDAKKASASNNSKYGKILNRVDTEVLACITLDITMSTAFIGAEHKYTRGDRPSRVHATFQQVAASIGKAVQTELLAGRIKAVSAPYLDTVNEYIKGNRTKSIQHILRTYRASAVALNIDYHPWTNEENIRVGGDLLEAVFATGLFVWDVIHNKGTYLLPHPNIQAHVEPILAELKLVVDVPPMLCKPIPHTTLYDGGYLRPESGVYKCTYKNRHITKREEREVARAFANAPVLKSALNKLQEVPYRINKFILLKLKEARACGCSVGIPSSAPPPHPEWALNGIDPDLYSDVEATAFKEWKSSKVVWYKDNVKRKSNLRRLNHSMDFAEEFKDEPVLYFPTCVDWRYRIYFKSTFNPQGDDVQKALLEFGEAKPLGSRGLFWLKVQVATCIGIDDVIFEKRVEWVDANIKHIRDMVEEPFYHSLFHKAADESPWQFLAAAHELVQALDSPNPEEFMSRIPVAMDATNSGGQHYAGMLRDPIAGELCNLYWTGRDTKADLYMDVVERTKKFLASAESTRDTMVCNWYWREHDITRGMAKRPTMTFVYSATATSRAKYIADEAISIGYEGIEGYSINKLSYYLGKIMEKAIQQANPAATEAMKFFQDICGRIPENSYFKWITPVGGLMINKYPVRKQKRLRFNGMGLNNPMVYGQDNNTNNINKAKLGIAPNIIHSLDGSHLAMIVAVYEGYIIPIHDSLATHACDVDTMHRIIREQFVKLYTENDIIEQVKEAAKKQGAFIYDVITPKKGDLDITRVLTSPFFFS